MIGAVLALALAWVSRWVCGAIACAKCVMQVVALLIKNAKGWLYLILVCPTF